MKKITLNFSERVSLQTILNSFKGELLPTAAITEDLKRLKILEEEHAQVDFQILTDDKGSQRAKWNPEKAVTISNEYEVSPESIAYFNKWIEEKDKKGEFTLSDVLLIDIKSKLNA